MKKVIEMKIKSNKDLDSEKLVSKIKSIVDELNEEQCDEFDSDETLDNELDIDLDISDIVKNMYDKDYSLKDVMEITGLSAQEIGSILEDYD